MAMEIQTQTTPAVEAKKEYSGSASLTMDSGKFRITTIPVEGDRILDIQVPSGKQWKVSVSVHIEETDL